VQDTKRPDLKDFAMWGAVFHDSASAGEEGRFIATLNPVTRVLALARHKIDTQYSHHATNVRYNRRTGSPTDLKARERSRNRRFY